MNRTSRYRNPGIEYTPLKARRGVIFLGLPVEYQAMRRELGATPILTPHSYLEMARAVAGCKLFIGNQSSPCTPEVFNSSR